MKLFKLFKNLHLFYFGRYWNEIETIIDLNQLNCIGKEVNLSGWLGLSINYALKLCNHVHKH